MEEVYSYGTRFSRCDEGALAVGELVSRTDKDSNASYG